MIKTGIAGADSEIAGDLIRILINHPEVDIISLFAPGKSGLRASSVHFGLLGEEPLVFTDSIDLSKIDILFVCRYSDYLVSALEEVGENSPKVVDVCGYTRNSETGDDEFIFGLSEIHRKSLVRGARKALLPLPVSSVSLVAMFPLAKNLLLNQSLEISVEIPAGMESSGSSSTSAADEINRQLSAVQLSFTGNIEPSAITERTTPERGIRAKITMKSPLSLEDLSKLYLDVYDDHNFTVLICRNTTDMKEVLGTDRIVISLSKETSDTINIEAIADEDMRGGAAEAVHIMNLLFGLHEKTGMTFLPTKR